MALDPLEKEQLRKRMAVRMVSFLEASHSVGCISGHYYDEPAFCELCQAMHATELVVIRNRAGKTMRVAVPCLKEMVRFQVADVDELPRWIEKLKDLKVESERRKMERELARQEERKLLEKRVIVRKRVAPEGA